jgi:hypothetical protein
VRGERRQPALVEHDFDDQAATLLEGLGHGLGQGQYAWIADVDGSKDMALWVSGLLDLKQEAVVEAPAVPGYRSGSR